MAWRQPHPHLVCLLHPLAPILSRLLSGSWQNYNPAKDPHWLNAILMAAALVLALFAFPGRQNLERQVEAKSPVKAVEFIRQNHLQGPMLNEYIYGGYLIWALPQQPDFIDSRADLFEWSGFLLKFGKWAMLREDPNRLLNEYKINSCLLAAQSPIVHVLPVLPNWKKIYSENNSVVFAQKHS